MPIAIATYSYNIKAVSVLQYVAQFIPLPRLFHQTEMGILHLLLHLPNNSFPLRALHSLQLRGGPALSSIACSCTAARIRASLSTLTGWKHIYTLLMITAEHFLDTARYLAGHRHVAHFDRPPIHPVCSGCLCRRSS